MSAPLPRAPLPPPPARGSRFILGPRRNERILVGYKSTQKEVAAHAANLATLPRPLKPPSRTFEAPPPRTPGAKEADGIKAEGYLYVESLKPDSWDSERAERTARSKV